MSKEDLARLYQILDRIEKNLLENCLDTRAIRCELPHKQSLVACKENQIAHAKQNKKAKATLVAAAIAAIAAIATSCIQFLI